MSQPEPGRSGRVLRALSLSQPYASLVASGAKRIETRSWRTHYRGPLAIHAARAFPNRLRALCADEPFRTALLNAGFQQPLELPRGSLIALCTLVDCQPVADAPPQPERSFGDYRPGRYMWLLANVQPLPEPVPARGRLGLWLVEL